MGYKKLSNEQEKILVEEYKPGVAVQTLMNKYGYKTKKSITDKVKKYYPETYQQIFEEAHKARKGYDYILETIQSDFDAYFLGLLLTDGYISDNRQVGLDLTDEDCISFLSKGIGKQYTTYVQKYNSEINGKIISQKKR